MTTYRIYETVTGQFVGRADGADSSSAIADYALAVGGTPEQFSALVEPPHDRRR